MATRFLTLVSTILLVAGVAMLIFYASSQLSASEGHRRGMEKFQMARMAQAAAPASQPDTPPSVDSAPAGDIEAAQAVAGNTMEESPTPQSDGLASAVAAPDKSLWSPKRIADYEKYADENPDMPER